MIRFARHDDVGELKLMWKKCFSDSDRFIEMFFDKKYKAENTLVYVLDNKIAGSLQMQQYDIRMYDAEIPFYYLVGLCTLPEYRNKGYMSMLIEKSITTMQDRNIALSILIPAKDWLYVYYDKFEFVETFEEGKHPIKLKQIIEKHSSLDDAFDEFDDLYQQHDFCVLKNRSDFVTIIEDCIEENYPPKYDLRAMSRIIDTEKILSLYAAANHEIECVLEIENAADNTTSLAYIKKGKLTYIDQKDVTDLNCETLRISNKLLTKLIFGYKLSQNEEKYHQYFKIHHPRINLMLE